MKSIILNKYTIAGILLFSAAAVFIVLALISNPAEITTAAYVISALVCVMTGVFIITFSSGEPIDPHLVGVLPAHGCITLCLFAHHLGMQGNAYFLPPPFTGEPRVMQFNPKSTYNGKQESEMGSFRKKGPAGLVTTPSCDLVIDYLKKRNALIIPDNKEDLSLVFRETIEDALKFAPRVSSEWHGGTVTITFHNYRYIDGCKLISVKSPLCCTKSPCPLCSLCGALIAEGLNKIVSLDRCSVNPLSKDVIAVFSILP